MRKCGSGSEKYAAEISSSIAACLPWPGDIAMPVAALAAESESELRCSFAEFSGNSATQRLFQHPTRANQSQLANVDEFGADEAVVLASVPGAPAVASKAATPRCSWARTSIKTCHGCAAGYIWRARRA